MQSRLPPVLIPEGAILARVGELAAEISRDYAQTPGLLLVGVLRGAYIFLADLSRRLTVPVHVDFVAASTYGEGVAADGVRLVMDLRSDIRGQHVLLVEDIADRGHTLRYLLDTLGARAPASLRCCVLVRKASRMQAQVPIDYLGFDIPDVWAVGYGLDFCGHHRSLPYIGAVDAVQSP